MNNKFIKQIFQDVDGCYSSKRTVVAIAVMLFLIAFFADLFFKLTIAGFIFEGVMWIIIGGLGITTLEGLPAAIAARKNTSEE